MFKSNLTSVGSYSYVHTADMTRDMYSVQSQTDLYHITITYVIVLHWLKLNN